MTRPRKDSIELAIFVERVPFDGVNPRSGEYMAQTRWQEDTYTAIAPTVPAAVADLAGILASHTKDDR